MVNFSSAAECLFPSVSQSCRFRCQVCLRSFAHLILLWLFKLYAACISGTDSCLFSLCVHASLPSQDDASCRMKQAVAHKSVCNDSSRVFQLGFFKVTIFQRQAAVMTRTGHQRAPEACCGSAGLFPFSLLLPCLSPAALNKNILFCSYHSDSPPPRSAALRKLPSPRSGGMPGKPTAASSRSGSHRGKAEAGHPSHHMFPLLSWAKTLGFYGSPETLLADVSAVMCIAPLPNCHERFPLRSQLPACKRRDLKRLLQACKPVSLPAGLPLLSSVQLCGLLGELRWSRTRSAPGSPAKGWQLQISFTF